MRARTKSTPPPLTTFELKRDAYGFAVRPQHLQRYREYANIYKEEEEERSDRWKSFLDRQAEFARQLHPDNSLVLEGKIAPPSKEGGLIGEDCNHNEVNKINSKEENGVQRETAAKEARVHKIQIWAQIRPSLGYIEQTMSLRVKKKKDFSDNVLDVVGNGTHLQSIEEAEPTEESDDEFYDVEKNDTVQDLPSSDGGGNAEFNSSLANGASEDVFNPWKEEVENLVRGGLPMAFRGELWQAFVGVRARRVEGYYECMLAQEGNGEDIRNIDAFASDVTNDETKACNGVASEKWKGQIEKDLPRTFPGHPALDEDGRNALRRLLTAYARHNPSVGYCQAMNFFAALFLLLMPEENAFWTLTGIIDDYFDGYFSEEMIECQVDQLVLEDLVRERFQKLVNHLDYLGVQIAWVAGPWFLSIFMNMLPWESVLRVWDVLLYDGNRVMLFRTALALMELYGPAIVTTKDAGDAVTLLQSLTSSTFDSSQLVLTACMGYQAVNETKLQELRNKHRPSVIAAMEERARGLRVWKDSKGLASKLYSFKHDPQLLVSKANLKEQLSDSENIDEMLCSLKGDCELDLPDLNEQVMWLKVELCKLLEEKRSAVVRAEELETALMEMVKQDNRRQLSAKVERLEQEVSELHRALADKNEQERAVLQVLMRVEQEQKVTEDARRVAEQDAAAQKCATHAVQEKYEEAMALLAQMENRAVMAETMLEATLQYQASQLKLQQHSSSSPRTPTSPSPSTQTNQESYQDITPRKISLLSKPFGFGWRENKKDKPSSPSDSTNGKELSNGNNERQISLMPDKDMNGHQEMLQ
ncbi:ecotropic viral integration site 5 protein homolog isoform X3 [Ananas comosus]|uniref:Ecotropic viral integration site 5 protein homolog isoform X3 n=1 Tax=Ananas comosus TaxID=4615 RepID=A0A6P5H296_ANACO|nr:ecotropic viral integration site 5 protein homolog isoform X3 [Ananas comosus]